MRKSEQHRKMRSAFSYLNGRVVTWRKRWINVTETTKMAKALFLADCEREIDLKLRTLKKFKHIQKVRILHY